MQPTFLKEILHLCRAHGFHSAIDTSGATDPNTFLDLAKHTDLLLYDIKCIDNNLHERFTGLGNEQILTNLNFPINQVELLPYHKLGRNKYEPPSYEAAPAKPGCSQYL